MILLFVIAAVVLGYLYQIQLQKLHQQEQALELARRDLVRIKADTEKKLAEIAEKRKILTSDTIAVAGEYRLLAQENYRDVTQGEATLHQAKEQLAQAKYEEAFNLARQAIGELKAAPRKKALSRVRRDDGLWDRSIGELKAAPRKKALSRVRRDDGLWDRSIGELKATSRKKILYHVRRDDCLWNIAKRSPLRSGFKWVNIWRANKNKIRDPNLIYPRQVLVIPVSNRT